MDIKHVLSCNPLRPGVRRAAVAATAAGGRSGWIDHDGGIVESATTAAASPSTTRGRARGAAAAVPRRRLARDVRRLAGVHRRRRLPAPRAVDVRRLAHRPATHGWQAPAYWHAASGDWQAFTLAGLGPVDPAAPVATSAGTRPTPSPAGPAPACRRGRVGDRRTGARRRRRRRLVRRGVAVDGQPVHRLSRVPAVRRRGRRVQRQVHGQPAGAARQLPGPRRPATPGARTATSSRRTPAGRSPASALAVATR